METKVRKKKGRHERNKLNVRQIVSLNEPGIYSDGGGLYVRVRAPGTRSWVFIYTLGGKRQEMGLGSLLDITLAKARERAAEAREKILDGIDPKYARRQEKAQVPAKPPVTFGEFALEYIASIEGGFKNPKDPKQWRSTLKTYAASSWSLPIDEVKTEHVLAAVQPIWLTKAETASRVRERMETVLDAAKAKGLREGENPARLRGHLDLLLPKRKKSVRHHSALPYGEIADFLKILRQRPATAARALEFTILTAARSGEVRGMTWGEVDLEKKVWTIPGERMKAGKIHRVPLSDPAAAILKAIRPEQVPPDTIVFLAPRGGQMSDMAMLKLLKRMERKDITVHGFRSTFRDWVGEETEFAREEAEMALAHTIESATERAYRRGDGLEKRRRLMDVWADYCAGVAIPTSPEEATEEEG